MTARRRAAVKRRLVEIATYAFAEGLTIVDATDDTAARVLTTADPVAEGSEALSVAYTWQGENVTTPTFFLGITTGRTDPDLLRSDHPSADTFTIEGRIEIPRFLTGLAAEEAVERMLNAFDSTLRSTRRLVHSDIESEMDPGEFTVDWCLIGEVDGPYHGFPDAARSASISGGCFFTIEAHTSIS